MNKTELLALADRCEAATLSFGEHDALALAIYRALGREIDAWCIVTRSLDNAMALVPPRPWRVCTLSDYPSENFQWGSGWFVNLSNDVGGFDRVGPVITVTARAPTPALAMTAACLRALATT